jgi:hypothetical protein
MGSKYVLLNDVTWLKQKYIDEKLSAEQISILAGAKTSNSARQALLRNDIEVRGISESLTINRITDFNINLDIINGCLLGDAGLDIYNPKSNLSYPAFYKKNKFFDHVLFVAEALSNTAKDMIKEEWGGKDKDGDLLSYPYFKYESGARKELLSLYRSWYPESNGFIKVVPQDLLLNSKMLLHWFLDDGSSSWRKRKYNAENPRYGRRNEKQVRLCFCSESFTKEDQERLCRQFKTIFGLDARTKYCQWGTGWRIHIPQSQVNLFLEIIGPPPVASLAYKWKNNGLTS